MHMISFRTPIFDRHRTLRASCETRMAGTLVDYARFVEVQQRRARIVAELRPLHDMSVAATGPATDQCIDVLEPPMPFDASIARGDLDVR